MGKHPHLQVTSTNYWWRIPIGDLEDANLIIFSYLGRSNARAWARSCNHTLKTVDVLLCPTRSMDLRTAGPSHDDRAALGRINEDPPRVPLVSLTLKQRLSFYAP